MTKLDREIQRLTFTERHTRLQHFLRRPINLFAEREVAGALIMLAAAAAALFWANSPWSEAYHTLWSTEIELAIGNWELHHLTAEEFVNEALMAIFFFVVGLEIKRELVTGELRRFRAAAVPAIGAIGGMVVPAAIFLALNIGGDGSNGWGIPVATDIAFAVGVVALLGSRVNPVLKLFLLTLAIVDDIGAILIIAVFYSDSLHFGWLLFAAVGLGVIRLARALHLWSTAFYVVVGVVVWYATLESGVHATIAGVIMGLMTPATSMISMHHAVGAVSSLDENASHNDMSMAAFLMNEVRPQTEILEHHLHPLSAFLIVPLFALANAGIEISGGSLSDSFGSGLAWGVILGLVVGKPLGIMLALWFATHIGFKLPKGVGWAEFAGIGMAAGIGFTVSIFVSGLAFDDGSPLTEIAKTGVLFASLLASLAAIAMLVTSHKLKKPTDDEPSDTDGQTPDTDDKPADAADQPAAL